MQITLSEKDLDNAVKLFLAYSGVVRAVSTLEFARKLKGEDAGISATLEMADHDIDPAELQALAMERKKVLEIDSPSLEAAPAKAASHTPPGAVGEPEEPNAITQQLEAKKVAATQAKAETAKTEAAEIPDEEIPFTDPVEDVELGNDLPDASPFADLGATVSAEAVEVAEAPEAPAPAPEVEEAVDFQAPAPSSNPFADDDADDIEEVPEAAEAPAAQAVNLFG